jgi:hypothetical protein
MMRGASFRAADAAEIWVIALVLFGAAVLPLCIRAVGRAPARVLPKVSLLVLGALVLLPGGLHVETSILALDRMLTQPRLRAQIDAVSPAITAIHRTMTEPQRTIGLGANLRAGSQALYGLEGIGGPDALTLATYDELVDAGPIDRPDGPAAAGGWTTMVKTAASLDRLAPLLDLLNVGFVLAPVHNLPQGLDEVRVPGADRLKVFRRSSAWPRAFSVDGVTTYASPQDLLGQVATHRSPLATILSSDGQALEATRHLRKPSGAAVPAHGYTLTTNTTSFAVRTAGPGVAVLTEMFLPEDFRATLNGQRVPYFRVNHTSKGVLIPAAGEWVVKFEYRPHRWDLSLAVACFGVLLLSGLVFLSRRRGSSAIRHMPAHVEPSEMSNR